MNEPALTRKPHDDPHQEGWDVYFGDVRIGHIGTRAGVPKDVDQWAWLLGFYPGTDICEGSSGIGATFEECRSTFEKAWLELKPKVTEERYILSVHHCYMASFARSNALKIIDHSNEQTCSVDGTLV